MKCKECDTVLTGRQREFCSDKCRKRASRAEPKPQNASGSPNTDKKAVEHGQTEVGQTTRTASHYDYDMHPEDYAPRTEPDKLNWGEWMDGAQLAEAGLTANRVPLPGDWDYKGVCKEVDGEWVVKPDPPAPVATLSDVDLQLKLKSYPGSSWVNSPEHKEVLKRRAAQPTGAWS